MADVQAHTARLIALFVSCVLYGILLMTFIPSIRSLLCSASQKFQLKRRADIKFPIVAATSIMFLVSSVSVVLSLQSVIDAFVDYKGPGGALELYDTVNAGWKHWIVAIEDRFRSSPATGSSNWRVIILPGSYYEATLPSAKRLNDHSTIPVLSGTLFLTFTTSVITTYHIVRRLFTVDYKTNLHGATQTHFLTRVSMVFFETGMIYTLSVVAALGVYLSGSNLEYVATLALIHIIVERNIEVLRENDRGNRLTCLDGPAYPLDGIRKLSLAV
ncbi:hypothetical protein DFH09DRAFT_1084394 [Mycena vulgaris]|nr:hypothetical protein DFH09DRAFT_1084394 [Mycena vulgaris]